MTLTAGGGMNQSTAHKAKAVSIGKQEYTFKPSNSTTGIYLRESRAPVFKDMYTDVL